jgi:hypothetical protein
MPITALNLLRCDPEEKEIELSFHFQECLKHVKVDYHTPHTHICHNHITSITLVFITTPYFNIFFFNFLQKFLDIDVQILNFDWHHNIKQLGVPLTIDALWTRIGPTLRRCGLSSGFVFTPTSEDTLPFQSTLSSLDRWANQHANYVNATDKGWHGGDADADALKSSRQRLVYVKV